MFLEIEISAYEYDLEQTFRTLSYSSEVFLGEWPCGHHEWAISLSTPHQ